MTEADARLALVRIREGFAFAGIVEELYVVERFCCSKYSANCKSW